MLITKGKTSQTEENTMQKNYNVTGEQRKQMVQVISREVGMEPVYMRMPTCAYAI